ncbi:MAG: ECF-type sigma factor [Pirellulaceae bacterium]
MNEAARIIDQLKSGNMAASEQLLPLVYDELRLLASRRLAKNPEQILQTTELVHEAYLRLIGPDVQWEGRAHFFAAAAQAMRNVLVDRARRRQSHKHGGNHNQVELHDSAISAGYDPDEILVVHDLFDRLAEQHPLEAEVAKLRYFVGFNHRETAEALEISLSTAHARWEFAKAWLYREYQKE